MGELGNVTEQVAPGTNSPVHPPPVPDPHGAPAAGGAGGPQVPDTGKASAAPDPSPAPKPKFPMPYMPPQQVPPAVTPPVVPGGGIGGIDSSGGARSPYLPDPNNPFPPGFGPGGPGGPPVTIDPTPGAGPVPEPTTPPAPPNMPYVPGYNIPPPGTPPGPPVTETHTTQAPVDSGSPQGGTPTQSPRPEGYEELDWAAHILGEGLKPPGGPGFEPKPPPAPDEPDEPGAADGEDSEPRQEIG